MNQIKEKPWLLGLGLLLLLAVCVGGPLIVTGSGVTLWVAMRDAATVRPTAAPPPTLAPLVQARPTPTPTIEPLLDPASPTPAATVPETPSPTPAPPTATATPLPTDAPTDTPVPPPETAPPPAQPPPPTATPVPTDTPAPAFPFTVVENDAFSTGNPGFDVFVAVTTADNKPLPGYRVLGSHSGGFQVEGPVSAGDWTENSGAKHYKGGNIKFQSANSPTGVWTLQLIDDSGQPVAAPVEIPFDTANPTWHFVLYHQTN